MHKTASTRAARDSHLKVEQVWKLFGESEAAAAQSLRSTNALPTGLRDTAVAVRDVSFDVERGETLVIMGLSGSGKSTLIRCITRLIEPTSGTVSLNGQLITSMSTTELREFHRHQCAMVFQHFGLFPHRRVLENVGFGLEIRGVQRKERESRSLEMLELVGLKDKGGLYPSQLSGGMKQRVGLARALAVDPDLLLFDEPFSALDPLIRRDLQDELLRLRNEVKKTMLFITHDMQEALKIGDRIAIMRDGAIVQIGSPEEIVLRPADEYVERFVSEIPRTHVLRVGAVTNSGPTLGAATAPEEALAQLDQLSRNELLVVDERGALLGGASLHSLRRAVARGDASLRDATYEVPTASEDEKLDAVTRLLARPSTPVVAVVDAAGALLGEVTAADILTALVGAPQTASEADEGIMRTEENSRPPFARLS
ncbi:quaternary amine ABC transporter ATP-binding protein [Leucobacter japonicus]|uniref:quaternary amine ABC transporter ATP-binding protein n=1 Tax=Leucobacter japonicus TaxID=1461259 RepID=UPI00094971E2|nr:betaine/proline/choline family ABC transporter ATP-binding protein [Leucobacter japonicus]